ncbi:MAG TPA: cation-transporting P-type ATPase, partial [Polyangiaceae bacterium]|nr:cation-transporting P-type ATPase [Polyangiaceae bacterium]
LQLGAGDRVSADVKVGGGRGLFVDNSNLTGESVPVPVSSGELAFAGTFVVEGEAQALVCATGRGTRLARIAELTQAHTRPRTPLARELSRLVRVVAVVAFLVGLLFFAVGALVGLPAREGFLLAIGVAVALVPEGLLPTVTLSLAMGAARMASRGALVRRLDAVETLGATTFICSDKTGTLTTNEMNAVEVWTPVGTTAVRGSGYAPSAEIEGVEEARKAAKQLALVASRCSSGRVLERDGNWVARGDPMEAALHALALRFGVDVESSERAAPERLRFPFDPRRRRMSVVLDEDVFVKGAPDSVVPFVREPGDATCAAAEMASRGLRVIAVARRKVISHERVESAEAAEDELTMCGLVGLLDPPRPEARRAIELCRKAGMRVAMVTGDQEGTARAIAKEVGLYPELVVKGAELPSDLAALGAVMDRDGVIACRVSPEQKLEIAKALQARGHVVAMTGDGVNDGPALQQADVGVAMGRSGTDVARAAADLVLLDDRFETIVDAIEQGRSTFSNIRRFLTYHLTDNVAELTPFALWALSGGRFPLALGVLQILCLDLLTDQLPALALGAEPPSPRTLSGPPRRTHLIDRALLLRAFAVLGPTESLIAMAVFALTLRAFGWQLGAAPPKGDALAAASAGAFVAIVFGQSATALCCRSGSRSIFRVPPRTNPRLLGALAVTWGVVLALLFVPWFARPLGHAPPPTGTWVMAALAFPAVVVVDTLFKRWWRERGDNSAGELTSRARIV